MVLGGGIAACVLCDVVWGCLMLCNVCEVVWCYVMSTRSLRVFASVGRGEGEGFEGLEVGFWHAGEVPDGRVGGSLVGVEGRW